MPFGVWGPPWGGFGWLFPLFGLLVMLVMGVFCVRMMGGGCLPRRGLPQADEVEALRREVRELKDELQKLREQR